MAEKQRQNKGAKTNRNKSDLGTSYNDTNFREETAAEVAAPVRIDRNVNKNKSNGGNSGEVAASGRGIGYAALALSILSLFVMPILFGAAGIILGFVALRRGAANLGGWAIGIGAIAIIVGMFVLPFF
ncbi:MULTISPECIES: hypothetical protein [Bacillus]